MRGRPRGRSRRIFDLIGEVFGARNVILLKDVDGLYTADPKTHADAKFIAQISAAELIEMKLPTLPIEPVLLQLLVRARLVKSVRIVNAWCRAACRAPLPANPSGR